MQNSTAARELFNNTPTTNYTQQPHYAHTEASLPHFVAFLFDFANSQQNPRSSQVPTSLLSLLQARPELLGPDSAPTPATGIHCINTVSIHARTHAAMKKIQQKQTSSLSYTELLCCVPSLCEPSKHTYPCSHAGQPRWLSTQPVRKNWILVLSGPSRETDRAAAGGPQGQRRPSGLAALQLLRFS